MDGDIGEVEPRTDVSRHVQLVPEVDVAITRQELEPSEIPRGAGLDALQLRMVLAGNGLGERGVTEGDSKLSNRTHGRGQRSEAGLAVHIEIAQLGAPGGVHDVVA